MNSKEVVEKLEDAQTEILKLGLLHFEENIEFSKDCLQYFIYHLITEWFIKYHSLNDQNEIETTANKHRSVVDIFRMTKNYFPEVTLESVLTELCYWGYKGSFGSIVCKDISKLTFFTIGSRGYGSSFPGYEWGVQCGVLKVTMKDITSYLTKEKCNAQ